MTFMPSVDEAKAAAKRLRRAIAEAGADPGHSRALELIAKAAGSKDWNTFVATASSPSREPQSVVPIVRIFDWPTARDFYLDFLGWQVAWGTPDADHDDHLPVYVEISGPAGARLHLSEHYGDGTPGGAVLIHVPDVDALHAHLSARRVNAVPPAVKAEAMGRTVTVHDPFGNRVTFVTPARGAGRAGDELPPIVYEITMPLPVGEAFARFTSFSWWRDYGLDPAGSAVIESGEVIFRNPAGDMSIGAVLDWQPGRRYAQTFTLAQDPDHPTRLDVTFRPAADGTLVHFEHGGWNATNASRRSHFADWPKLLSPLTRG